MPLSKHFSFRKMAVLEILGALFVAGLVSAIPVITAYTSPVAISTGSGAKYPDVAVFRFLRVRGMEPGWWRPV